MSKRIDISYDREVPAKMTDVIRALIKDGKLIVQVNAHNEDRSLTVQAFVHFDAAPRIGEFIQFEDKQMCQVTEVMHRLRTVHTKHPLAEEAWVHTEAVMIIVARLLSPDEIAKRTDYRD